MEAAAARSEDFGHVNMASSFKGPPTQNPESGKDYKNLVDPQASADHDTSSTSSSITPLSEEFEHLSAYQMNEATASLQHQVHIDPDRPEISMQIRNVEQALQSLSEGTVASEITTHLSQLVPKIIRLERKVKMQTTLRGIFEEKNQELNSQVEQLKADMDEVKEENRKLQEEVGELKRVKEDEQLREFHVVTKKEAGEMQDAEKKATEKHHSTPSAGAISEESHYNLQRKYLSLKKQIEEIVKVNHSWDEHYRNMKAQLEARIEDLQKQLDDTKNQTLVKQTGDEKARDDIFMQARVRIEMLEKERAGALAEIAVVNQKCEKLERYARSLTNQRNEMEKEIKRLNEALAQKMKSNYMQSGGIPPKQEDLPPVTPASTNLQVQDQKSLVAAQKVVQDMSAHEMREEIELLRQQNEVFQSDFIHERHDRQRVMGELDVAKKELRHTQKQMKQYGQQNMMYEDIPLAQDLQRGYMYQRERPYSTSAPPRDYDYYVYHQPPGRYAKPFVHDKTGRLIAHGKGSKNYNLAANDVYIDGDTQIDAGLAVTDYNQVSDNTNDQENNRICPRCERTFDNDPDYHVHINACIED